MNRSKMYVISLFTFLFSIFVPINMAPAAVQRSGDNCVSDPEWGGFLNLGTVNHSPRRSVIEDLWKVSIVGTPNRYWKDTQSTMYSVAYNFCSQTDYKIIVVYRKKSDAVQYAIKGQFV